MEHLLYLVHRIPYPPDKGDKIRSFHWLRQLSEHYHLHLGCFVDDPSDWKYIDQVNGYCDSTCILPLNKKWATVRSLKGLISGDPLTVPYYQDATMSSWVASTLSRLNIQRVLVFSSSMAQYLPASDSKRQVVMDYVDVDSDKWRQYAERKPYPLSWIYQREYRQLAKFELQHHDAAQATAFVSEDEVALFNQQNGLQPSVKVVSIANGVDTDFFDPNKTSGSPYGREPVVVFAGAMDYWANIDAVVWFVQQVWPLVTEKIPDARFYVVGSNPAESVTQLAGDSVVVTGRVEDIRPYVVSACVVVAPLRIARGIQNKVLEAYAMAKPLVATPAAMEGLPGGERFASVVQEANDFAAHVVGLLEQPQENEGARTWVRDQYSWSGVFSQLLSLIENQGEKNAVAQ